MAESDRDLSIWHRGCGEHGEAAAVPRGPLFKWMHILEEGKLGRGTIQHGICRRRVSVFNLVVEKRGLH